MTEVTLTGQELHALWNSYYYDAVNDNPGLRVSEATDQAWVALAGRINNLLRSIT